MLRFDEPDRLRVFASSVLAYATSFSRGFDLDVNTSFFPRGGSLPPPPSQLS